MVPTFEMETSANAKINETKANHTLSTTVSCNSGILRAAAIVSMTTEEIANVFGLSAKFLRKSL